VVRGVYLLQVDRLQATGGRSRLSASGYEIRRGRATRSIRGVSLEIDLAGLLSKIRGVGRDLEIVPAKAGCFGSPTLLLTRMELG
jgi:predicted Zn-dependent protease